MKWSRFSPDFIVAERIYVLEAPCQLEKFWRHVLGSLPTDFGAIRSYFMIFLVPNLRNLDYDMTNNTFTHVAIPLSLTRSWDLNTQPPEFKSECRWNEDMFENIFIITKKRFQIFRNASNHVWHKKLKVLMGSKKHLTSAS